MYPASQMQMQMQLQEAEQLLSPTALATLQPPQPASMTIGPKLIRAKTESVLTIYEDSDEELTNVESWTVPAKTFHKNLLAGALIVTFTMASVVSDPGGVLHTKGEDAATALLKHNLVYHIYLVSYGLALVTSLIVVILSLVDKDPNSTRLSKALWTSLVGMVFLFTLIAFIAFVGSASFLARAFL